MEQKESRFSENEARLCATKAGNGYKIVVNGIWYYTSKQALLDAVNEGKSCTFRTIEAQEA